MDVLNEIFLFGDVPAGAEKGAYAPFLILLSYMVASLGSFTGLAIRCA